MKHTEVIEEHRKESIFCGNLFNQYLIRRIIGQHEVRETTEAEVSDKKDQNNNANADEKRENVSPQLCEQMTNTDYFSFWNHYLSCIISTCLFLLIIFFLFRTLLSIYN